jgi:hypothetical protein
MQRPLIHLDSQQDAQLRGLAQPSIADAIARGRSPRPVALALSQLAEATWVTSSSASTVVAAV